MAHLTRKEAIEYLQSRLNAIIAELKQTERGSARWDELQQEYKTVSADITAMFEYKHLEL